MRVVQINATYAIGSTGKIMRDLDHVISENGHQSYMVCAYAPKLECDNVFCTNEANYQTALKSNILISRLTGKMGYRHKLETQKMIEWIGDKKPDIIHLHNIHGDWINLELLFAFLKKMKKPIVWTLHDCWGFTGRCSHFELCGCDKWKTGCVRCENRRVYPITYFLDWSKPMWSDKKKWYSEIENMHIVTPSDWLGNYVKQSILGNNSVQTIHNGIDTSIYYRKKSRPSVLGEKKIVLGVANSWSKYKGLDDFIQLDKQIDHSRYQVMLVGVTKSQKSALPNTIIGIQRTSNESELVEIYNKASVFVNLTYQDNFPTTNMEAAACGTPAITYDTGGSPESILNPQWIIPQGDISLILAQIEEICNADNYEANSKDVARYAVENFSKNLSYQKYIALYEEILSEKGVTM